MDFSDFTFVDWMLLKGALIVGGAMVYGFWIGLTGPQEQAPRE